jgi:hydrogenase maturation protease
MSDARPAERLLVLGLGNPILGDDGVGWRVAALAGERLAAAGQTIEVDCVAVGGLALMERLVGYDRVVLVDAVQGSGDRPGTVKVRALADIPSREAGHLDSAHDVPIMMALETGRTLGASLPREIAVVSVEAVRVDTFGEALTPAVADAVEEAADAVARCIAGHP